MQAQQRLVRMPSAGMLLVVAILVAAAFAVVAFYLARPAGVSGTSSGSPSISTRIDKAHNAAERDLGPVCSSSICNPNAGEVQTDRNSGSGQTDGQTEPPYGGIQFVP